MADSNNINLAVPNMNPYFAVALLAICQVVDTVGDVAKEYIKASSGDQPKVGKFVSSVEAPCLKEFHNLLDQIIYQPEIHSVLLVRSDKGCKMVVTHDNGTLSEAFVPH